MAHISMFAGFDGVHRHSGESGGDHAVHEIGAARAEIVSQVADDGLFPGGGLDFVAQILGHAHLFAMAERVRVAVFFYL
jgi:hypothetical protein